MNNDVLTKPMEANFKYDAEKALALCKQYSDSWETLEALIVRLELDAHLVGVESSQWHDEMLCVRYWITVCGYRFAYFGSHADAKALHPAPSKGMPIVSHKDMARKKAVHDRLLHSVLCCIGSDYNTDLNDPEDLEAI